MMIVFCGGFPYLLKTMRTIFCILLLSMAFTPARAKFLQDSADTKTIIAVPKFYPVEKVITGDTLITPRSLQDSITLPGAAGNTFTPYQDTAYVRALRLGIPAI